MLKYFGKLQYQEHVTDNVFYEYVSGHKSKRVRLSIKGNGMGLLMCLIRN